MKRHSSPRRCLPGIEVLEGRCLPSHGCTVSLDKGSGSQPDQLVIRGSNQDDRIIIRDNGKDQITVTCNGHRESFRVARDTEILVDSRGGDDEVQYRLTDDLLRNRTRDISVDLGRGEDEFLARLDGDLRRQAELTLDVQGEQGEDDLEVRAKDVNVREGAILDLNLRGNQGQDSIVVLYQGELDGEFKLRADGGERKDQVFANLKLEEGSTGDLDAEVLGGSGDDLLALFVSTQSEDDEHEKDVSDDNGSPTVKARLDGGEGEDRCAHTENVVAVNCEKHVSVEEDEVHDIKDRKDFEEFFDRKKDKDDDDDDDDDHHHGHHDDDKDDDKEKDD